MWNRFWKYLLFTYHGSGINWYVAVPLTNPSTHPPTSKPVPDESVNGYVSWLSHPFMCCDINTNIEDPCWFAFWLSFSTQHTSQQLLIQDINSSLSVPLISITICLWLPMLQMVQFTTPERSEALIMTVTALLYNLQPDESAVSVTCCVIVATVT
jgi:hypothetical protein